MFGQQWRRLKKRLRQRDAAAGETIIKEALAAGVDATYFVARKQVEAPLKWIASLWGSGVPLVREFGKIKPIAKLEIITGASPSGLGGYFAHASTGTPLAFFADALSDLGTERFQVEIGPCKGQAIWEALALLVAIRVWGSLVA